LTFALLLQIIGALSKLRSKKLRLVVSDVFALTRTRGFRKYLQNLVVELCRFDTTPKPDVARMRSAEDGCFRVLERELSAMSFDSAQLKRWPINPAIQALESYSQLHFTKSRQRPEGLTAEEAYAGRSNLLFIIPGNGAVAGGQALAINGHIDVVAPYFPPRLGRGVIFGRGSCDDKGPVVAAVAALKLISKLLTRTGQRLNRNVVLMLVVDEETGGNGSLSLAIDRGLKAHYDSILVCECTGLKLHPANRGAVWYQATLKPPAGVSALELFAFIIEELEKEGAAVRAESRHDLFPQRPVQTCHGVLSSFGEHPSRICGHVRFVVRLGHRPERSSETLVLDCLETGLAAYTGLYGDKTKALDPVTRKPMVARHYDFNRTATGFQIDVYGATGHMGAIRERDGAITKMAHLVRSLVCSKPRLEKLTGRPVSLGLNGASVGATLMAEGGQGFVPTHSMKEVMTRLRAAAERGAENYLRRVGRFEKGSEVVQVRYDKLHNAAFEGDPDSLTARNAVAAARTCRLPQDKPLLGWTVSCDARLFANEYPGMPVLTFGPGRLAHAHSDQEQIAVEGIRKAAEFLSLFILRQTGTVEFPDSK
jgi:acetylornithine deacetylase/succinyl-diaminopimelate desuccinylase-like protein